MVYRIMIVEDDFLLAEALALMVRTLGHEVVGPFGRLDPALEAARSQPLDAALLDVQIRRDLVYPVADILRERAVPYGFVTSSDLNEAPPAHRLAPAAAKPVDGRSIASLIAKLIAQSQWHQASGVCLMPDA